MATAIEYGLISALIAVVGVAAANAFNDPTPNKVTQLSLEQQSFNNSILKVSKPGVPAYAYEVVDKETGCKYIRDEAGISIRYTKYGSVDCPNSDNVKLTKDK